MSQQAVSNPNEVWTHGAEDYLHYAKQLLAEFKDVIDSNSTIDEPAKSAGRQCPLFDSSMVFPLDSCSRCSWPRESILSGLLERCSTPAPPDGFTAPATGPGLFSFVASSAPGLTASSVPAFSFGAAPAFGAAAPTQEEEDEPEKDEPEVRAGRIPGHERGRGGDLRTAPALAAAGHESPVAAFLRSRVAWAGGGSLIVAGGMGIGKGECATPHRPHPMGAAHGPTQPPPLPFRRCVHACRRSRSRLRTSTCF